MEQMNSEVRYGEAPVWRPLSTYPMSSPGRGKEVIPSHHIFYFSFSNKYVDNILSYHDSISHGFPMDFP